MDKAALEVSLRTLDIWLIVFGVLVAIGVVGESVAGFLHWRRSGELAIIQTSENLALQREVWDARTAFEKYKAPRNISTEDQSKMIDQLKPFKNTRFAMSVIPGDPEAMALQTTIHEILKRAEWNWVDWNVVGGPLSIVFSNPGAPNVGQIGNVGIGIIIDPSHADKLWPATHALSKALSASGFDTDTEALSLPQIPNKEAIAIIVGKKP